ncbi:hypothetical protein Syun_013487 [Stephania yunnanensis]|uniref:Uncharacterized protein n=1 Tax=Stephania yunnanensis TaxID=152371 RepID=A0AAP0JHR6_9MAGN
MIFNRKYIYAYINMDEETRIRTIRLEDSSHICKLAYKIRELANWMGRNYQCDQSLAFIEDVWPNFNRSYIFFFSYLYPT